MAPYIQFVLNGQQHQVPNTVHPATRLVDYIRQTALLKGTKVNCREGGCGVCVVTVQYKDHVTNKDKTRAINSCLCPLYIADGWQITTTEGLGGQHGGFHPIQERMAEYSASQCGFCTPGFVMSMYGLLSENPQPTSDDVVQAIDGNLCRCTGYRVIVDAMTSFAKDGKAAKTLDIEDIQNLACLKKKIGRTAPVGDLPIMFKNWQRPKTLVELYNNLKNSEGKKSRLVVGNTATGVYKRERYDLYFDTSNIKELYKVKECEDGLELGANLTLTDLQEMFNKYKAKSGFEYLEKLEAHISLIANTPIRNVGCWAGNLMMQHDHPEFVSDLLPPLEALGTKIILGTVSGETMVSVQDLMSEDMSGKVILSMKIPSLSEREIFMVYKVMLRARSSHAYVTAGFKVSLKNKDKKSNTVEDACLVFGGLNSGKKFHVKEAEKYLKGKTLQRDDVIIDCLQILKTDMSVNDAALSSAEYRTHVAQNVLFKFLAQFGSNGTIAPVTRLDRPVPKGSQDFETHPDFYPITKPMSKLSGKIQASGEAVFLDDIPIVDNELAGLLVLSTEANATIENIDVSAALAIPGVVDVLTAKDVPGQNYVLDVQLLADGTVNYHGQPVAVVLAEDLSTAYRAYGLVKVTYKNVEKPLININEAISKNSFHGSVYEKKTGNIDEAFKSCKRVIEGRFKHGSQYHFYMENQGCLVAPFEDRFDVWTSTQSTDLTQMGVAMLLGIPSSRVKVGIKRVGGAFGGKVLFGAVIPGYAAVGAVKTNRPVRMTLSLETCMKITAHRPEIRFDYKIGVDNDGKIKAMDSKTFWRTGATCQMFEPMCLNPMVDHSDGAYHIPNIRAKGYIVKTNHQISTSMRSPAQLPAHMAAEQMMEHVAHELGEDPVTFKQKHLIRQGQMVLLGTEMPSDNLQLLWDQLLVSADVNKRQQEIAQFNKENQWLKRGIAMTPAKFSIIYRPTMTHTVYMAVYNHDGSIHITHGGVEFGQGLDTKIAQVVMKYLGVPLDCLKIEAGDSVIAPNTGITAGSMPSEFICRTVQECCKTLLEKLAPIKEQNPDADWITLVKTAHGAGVHMAVTQKYVSPETKILTYPTLGVCVAEAEVDVLTGESRIVRADIHMDLGYSANPTIDVGQIEGAVGNGLGLMLMERDMNSEENGQMLTASTWDYKIPMAGDMPADMRVSFLKGKPNENGVTSSKALGEPPMCTTPVFLQAVRAAVIASRRERGKTGFVDLYAPATPEKVLKACDLTTEELCKSTYITHM